MQQLCRLDPRVKLVCLVLFVIVALHARTPAALGLCLAAAVCLAAAAHVTLADARRVLMPLAPIVVITVVMQLLYYQQGEVLVALGPLSVTVEALAAAARMCSSLVAVMLASVAFMRCSDTGGLARSLNWALSPFRAAGVRVEGLMFALSVAFRFVPVLADEFSQLKRAQLSRSGNFGGGVRQKVSAYARLFAPLARSSFRRADSLAEASVARCLSYGPGVTSLHVASFGALEIAALVVTVLVVLAALVF